jgi:hypothetical protein
LFIDESSNKEDLYKHILQKEKGSFSEILGIHHIKECIGSCL